MAKLVSYLTPGGSLLVADFIKARYLEAIFPEHVHMVPHKEGFDSEDMRSTIESAGLHSFFFLLAKR